MWVVGIHFHYLQLSIVQVRMTHFPSVIRDKSIIEDRTIKINTIESNCDSIGKKS